MKDPLDDEIATGADPLDAEIASSPTTAKAGFWETTKKAIGEGRRMAAEAQPFGATSVSQGPKSWTGKFGASMIPESPGQAVATGLMAAAGPAAAPLNVIGKAAPALGRVLAGTGAGATGAAIDEGDVARGALLGGGVTAGIEAGAPLIGTAIRAGFPGLNMKRRIANLSATDILGWLKKHVGYDAPVATTASGRLQEAATSTGGLDKFLQGKFGDALATIDRQIASQASTGNIPRGTQYLSFPEISQNKVSLREVQDYLNKIRQAGYSGQAMNPITRVPNAQFDARRHAEDILGRVQQQLDALDPAAAEAYRAARGVYSKGQEMQRLLEHPGSFTQGMLNTPSLQRRLQGKDWARTQEHMNGAEGELVDKLFRGAERTGSTDVLTPGAGGALDALRQVYGRGQGGFPQVVGSAARTLLPNLGSKYVGRAPYTPPEGLKYLMDVLGINLATGAR